MEEKEDEIGGERELKGRLRVRGREGKNFERRRKEGRGCVGAREKRKMGKKEKEKEKEKEKKIKRKGGRYFGGLCSGGFFGKKKRKKKGNRGKESGWEKLGRKEKEKKKK